MPLDDVRPPDYSSLFERPFDFSDVFSWVLAISRTVLGCTSWQLCPAMRQKEAQEQNLRERNGLFPLRLPPKISTRLISVGIESAEQISRLTGDEIVILTGFDRHEMGILASRMMKYGEAGKSFFAIPALGELEPNSPNWNYIRQREVDRWIVFDRPGRPRVTRCA